MDITQIIFVIGAMIPIWEKLKEQDSKTLAWWIITLLMTFYVLSVFHIKL